MDDTSVLDHYLAPLRPFLEPAAVTEVVINRPGEVGVEADGTWRWFEAPELTEAWLRTLAVAAAAYTRNSRSVRPPCPATCAARSSSRPSRRTAASP
jgi:type IV secretion system protein VirB11